MIEPARVFRPTYPPTYPPTRSGFARHAPPHLLETVAALLRVVMIGLFLLTFLLQPFRIPSGSMEPTLEIGDFVLVSKAGLGPKTDGLWSRFCQFLLPPAGIHRGDMVVFHFPPDPSRDLVKRVVALPGERLRLHAGHVFIEGRPLQEPYALYTPGRSELFRDEFPNLREADPSIDPHWWLALRRQVQDGELLVPPHSYFVLGDNRNNSEDSRYWGFVPEDAMIGRPLLVYFAVPNGADAPEGGPIARLWWVLSWVRQRAGIPR